MQLRWLVVAAALFLAWAMLATGFWVWDPVAADYRVFERAAESANPYVDSIFPYPPTALLLFRPLLANVPLLTGYMMLWAFSILAFYSGSRQHFDHPTSVMALVSAAAIEGLVTGQFAMLFAGAILWAFSFQGMRRGLILGVVAAIKPQLLVLAPIAFLVRRDWSSLAGMAASGVAMVALSLLYGPSLWLDWLSSLDDFRQFLIDDHTMHRIITPAGVADFRGLVWWPFLTLGIAVATLTVALTARRLDGAALAGLIVGLAPLAVPYALPHDTLAAVPLACVLLLRRKVDWITLPAICYFAGQFLLPVTLLAAVGLIVRRNRLLGVNAVFGRQRPPALPALHAPAH